ncbi:uncharacterized protein [Leptinotarsa decemlineata]|uniref:uncharacterized protein n=1 Tax=Leptinotarsa decemlineata TaxID=7539 RepID=UPI003D30B3E4
MTQLQNTRFSNTVPNCQKKFDAQETQLSGSHFNKISHNDISLSKLKSVEMGNCFYAFYERFCDYPLKKSRSCAYHLPFPGQEDSINKEQDDGSRIKTQYEEVMDEFNRLLLEKRIENRSKVKGQTWEEKNILTQYPEWNESTISYLHSLFVSFCDDKNKQIDFKSFSCILESLGDESSMESRKHKFEEMDQDHNGYIEYTDFLYLVYNFNSIRGAKETSLRVLCLKMTEKIKAVERLSIGQQLEYGLF